MSDLTGPMRRSPWVLVLLLASAVSVPVAAGDHPIPIENSGSDTITFDHKAGNEWWVEVKVTPPEVGVDDVLARAENGTWHRLTLRSWGNWAASFHVPPGERVQFQASRAGGMSDVYRQTSCFFTHPAGVEQCDGQPSNLQVNFHDPQGHRWWQSVFADSNTPLKQVLLLTHLVNTTRAYGMEKQDWGAWATSRDVPEGTMVQFLASDGAETQRSPCYRWPNASALKPPVVPCFQDQGPGEPTGAHTRFDHKGGGEWWVEVRIAPLQPTRVLAQDTGGEWKELNLRSWGNWAGSFHIAPGNEVRFRALVGSEWYESCWYSHPKGFSNPHGLQVCGATTVS